MAYYFMKFICDQMLVRMGRWLRAAGHDSKIADENQPDREILELALKEDRIILTRDKHFLEMKEAAPLLVWLKSNSLKDCIKELNRKIYINWLVKPFSRCLICNQELCEVSAEDYKESIPAGMQIPQKLWLCSNCNKIFWEGSHTKRMLEQLKKWQSFS